MAVLELAPQLRGIGSTPYFQDFCDQAVLHIKHTETLRGENLKVLFTGRLWELVANDYLVRGGYVNGGNFIQTDVEVVAFYQEFLTRLYGYPKSVLSFPFGEITLEYLTTPDAMIVDKAGRAVMLFEHTTAARRPYYELKQNAYQTQMRNFRRFPEFTQAVLKYVVPLDSPAHHHVKETDLIRVGLKQNDFNEAANQLLGSLTSLAPSFMGL